jgi:hypothetical protein
MYSKAALVALLGAGSVLARPSVKRGNGDGGCSGKATVDFVGPEHEGVRVLASGGTCISGQDDTCSSGATFSHTE